MEIESIISDHLSRFDPDLIDSYSRSFKETSLVKFDNLIPWNLFLQLREEAQTLLASESRRRDVIIKESGNTPRAYLSVGRDIIAKRGKLIPAIFHSESIRKYLSSIVGEEIAKVPYEPEEFIINSQQQPGDTHGWHWDDYAYAFIWMIEEPDPLSGGRVEFIPNIKWNKDNTEEWLKYNLSTKTVLSEHIKTGQCYFMKANTTLHRVSPIIRSTNRIVAILTYASQDDLISDDITHFSMEDIYPEIAGNFI